MKRGILAFCIAFCLLFSASTLTRDPEEQSQSSECVVTITDDVGTKSDPTEAKIVTDETQISSDPTTDTEDPTTDSSGTEDPSDPATDDPGTATDPGTVTDTEGIDEPTAPPEDFDPVSPSGYGLVPQSVAADKSYFDDAAFVGDSVSLKLSYYQAATKALGQAQFFTAGSLGSGNALWEVSEKSYHPSFQGTKMPIEDCIQLSGAKKIYIMLGMNDIAVYGIEGSIRNYKILVERIRQKSPDTVIFVQSMTPMTATSRTAGRNLNNTNIKAYNRRLLETCKEMDWYFVDVSSVMWDASGEYLNRAYCSDPDGMGMHFTDVGCTRWVEYLLTHTVEFADTYR